MEKKEETILNDKKAFAEQWKIVKKKYPLVAIRYLELINLILDGRYRVASFDKSFYENIDGCDPESPIRLPDEFCDSIPSLDPPPRHCTPARDYADLDRYLKCLDQRIGQIG